MRDASPALIALLAGSRQFQMADLFTFTLSDGTVLRYSAAPIALTVAGNIFALGPKFERGKTKTVIGTQVDELEVRTYPEPTDLVGNFTFLNAAWSGIFDGALLQLERVFMPVWGDTSPGTIVLFAGRVSEIQCGRSAVTMKCRSHLELLNIQMPRRLIQASCGFIFGGPMCLFDRTTMAATFACQAGSTQSSIKTALTPSPATLYNQGTITGTAGANTGHSRSISELRAGAFSVKLPFLSTVVTGDQFQVLPGCDKTLATCDTVFANKIHFGGFSFLPTPETAV